MVGECILINEPGLNLLPLCPHKQSPLSNCLIPVCDCGRDTTLTEESLQYTTCVPASLAVNWDHEATRVWPMPGRKWQMLPQGPPRHSLARSSLPQHPERLHTLWMVKLPDEDQHPHMHQAFHEWDIRVRNKPSCDKPLRLCSWFVTVTWPSGNLLPQWSKWCTAPQESYFTKMMLAQPLRMSSETCYL